MVTEPAAARSFLSTNRNPVRSGQRDQGYCSNRSPAGYLAARWRLKARLRRRDYTGALDAAEQVLARNPWDIGAQVDLARAAEELELFEMATWSLEQAGHKMPGGGWAGVATWVHNAQQGSNGLKIVSADPDKALSLKVDALKSIFPLKQGDIFSSAKIRKAMEEYGKVYGALAIMAAFFSTIMTVLFKARDRVLVWQKGVIKW